VSQDVVQTVQFLKEKARFPLRHAVRLIGLSGRTYFRWARTKGKVARPAGTLPRGHCLLSEEGAAILAFKRRRPQIGYQRRTWMMVNAGGVAVSPASVHRVLQEAGLLTVWTREAGKEDRQGFVQPTCPHGQWHTDIAYLNIRGTHYFFRSVLDGYSRLIVHHEIRLAMETRDVEIVMEEALGTLPKDHRRPRPITGNGSQYLSGEFKSYLREREIGHAPTRVRHPQSNGKVERFHKTLKSGCLRQTALPQLEEDRSLISRYVEEYNTWRLDASLKNLTSSDDLKGAPHVVTRLEARKKDLEKARLFYRAVWQKKASATFASNQENCHSIEPLQLS
jgi:transposase InsO family protein